MHHHQMRALKGRGACQPGDRLGTAHSKALRHERPRHTEGMCQRDRRTGGFRLH
jgi:hypothetical protein